jgi:hypothetical protein
MTMERSARTTATYSDDEHDGQHCTSVPPPKKAVKATARRPSLGQSLAKNLMKATARRPSLGQSQAKNLDKLLERSRSTVACSDDEDDHYVPSSRVKATRRPSLGQSLAKNLDKLSCITPTRKKKTVSRTKSIAASSSFSGATEDSFGTTETNSPSRSAMGCKGHAAGCRKGNVSDDKNDDEGSIDLNCNTNSSSSDAMPFVGRKQQGTPPSPYSSAKAGIASLFSPGGTFSNFPLAKGHASTPNLRVHIDLDDSSPNSVLGGGDDTPSPSQQHRQKMNLMEMFSNSCGRFKHYSDDMSSDGGFSLDGSTTDSPRSTKGSSSSRHSKTGGVLATPAKTPRRRMRRQSSSDLPGPPSLAAGDDASVDGGYESTCSGCSFSSSGARSVGGASRVRRVKVKRSKSKVKATALLDGIQREIEIQTRAMQEHDRFINIQVKIAKTRLSMGNEMSAALAYKKAKKVQAERARVVQAIKVLERHLAGVQGQLDKAKAIAEAQLIEGNNNINNNENSSTTTSRTTTKVVIDFQAHKNYAQEVAHVLSGGQGSEEPDDNDELSMKDLLAELEAFPQ